MRFILGLITGAAIGVAAAAATSGQSGDDIRRDIERIRRDIENRDFDAVGAHLEKRFNELQSNLEARFAQTTDTAEATAEDAADSVEEARKKVDEALEEAADEPTTA